MCQHSQTMAAVGDKKKKTTLKSLQDHKKEKTKQKSPRQNGSVRGVTVPDGNRRGEVTFCYLKSIVFSPTNPFKLVS